MEQSEIKQLSTADLREKIKEEKSHLDKVRMSHAVSPVESPIKIRDSRKTVAKLMTELRQRELAEIKK